ncbi:hypothetical protein DRJ48_02115 [Candidatus Woesearchaeota archaeon]|nr:ribosomal L7Ae/L30e/S12e/Gadd45 family protein [Candidatus Woesearchaeota archaeon]RLE43010.1 MAG: hypothetical protein DRJ48_02115 [Candidatus Woesearchaeota archaeon]
MGVVEEIKQGIEKGLLVIGKNSVLKGLKRGKLAKVFMASNIPEAVELEVTHLCEISGVKYKKTKITNKELGALCKKSYSISILGLMSAK